MPVYFCVCVCVCQSVNRQVETAGVYLQPKRAVVESNLRGLLVLEQLCVLHLSEEVLADVLERTVEAVGTPRRVRRWNYLAGLCEKNEKSVTVVYSNLCASSSRNI